MQPQTPARRHQRPNAPSYGQHYRRPRARTSNFLRCDGCTIFARGPPAMSAGDRFAVMRTSLVVMSLLLACSKSSSDQKAGSAAPAGSSAASAPAADAAAAAEPAEAATVVGPTKSAKGVLELSGLLAGKFEWIKKDQKAPISCAWSAEKEIGGLSIDLSDGAGKMIKLTIDIPPPEAGSARLDVTSKDLAQPLKTKFGFNMSGDDEGNLEVKFDSTLAADEAAKPSDPSLKIKGTLEVTCPKKK